MYMLGREQNEGSPTLAISLLVRSRNDGCYLMCRELSHLSRTDCSVPTYLCLLSIKEPKGKFYEVQYNIQM